MNQLAHLRELLAARQERRSPLDSVGTEPDYRFSLANERTYLAWVRTALALLAGGVAVVQLVPNFWVDWARELLGVILVVLATAIAATSYARWQRRERAMRVGGPLPASLLPWVTGVGLAVVSLLALAFILIDIARGEG
ncbi:MAG: DUF202 domain-containing protein [Frankia sp.]|nr:DUF202 domain-containing protein [Frankia sp.]